MFVIIILSLFILALFGYALCVVSKRADEQQPAPGSMDASDCEQIHDEPRQSLHHSVRRAMGRP